MSADPSAEPEVTREQYEAAIAAKAEAETVIGLYRWQEAERAAARVERLLPGTGLPVTRRVLGPFPPIVALLAVCLLLAGCVTRSFYPSGKPRFETYANVSGLRVNADGSFSADRLDHSTPTRAAGSVIGTTTSGIGGVITAAGVGGVLK